MTQRLFVFAGGEQGEYRILEQRAIAGAALPPASRLSVGTSSATSTSAVWALTGIVSNERYVTSSERAELVARQVAIGRPDAPMAALIPIKKSAAWWSLAQDERRAILEERSEHIRIGLAYLPAIARRLHHCRDLGSEQPFDFLTWFDFAEADAPRFDELLARLRASPEWDFVEREVEVRVVRES